MHHPLRYQLILTALFFLIPSHSLSALEPAKKEELKQSLQLAQGWFLNAQREKGIFQYLYDPQKDVYSQNNNEIRQLMASRLLAEMAQTDPRLLPAHRKNLSFIFRYWVQQKENYSHIVLSAKSKLGANAMMLRALVASPDYLDYKQDAEKFKAAIMRSINADGSMRPFLLEPSYKYDPDYLLTFYSGEALVALIEYYQKEQDPELLQVIKRSQDFYLEKYVKNIERNYYPAYVPWHTISLNLLYKITHDQRYADGIFTMNDKLLELQDRHLHVGRFFNPRTPQYGNPHASSDGVYTEGLGYAFEIASIVADKQRMNAYRSAIEIGLMHLTTLQYTAANSRMLPAPDRAVGAFRISLTSPTASFSERQGSNIRIDCVQHSIDALRKYFKLKLS